VVLSVTGSLYNYYVYFLVSVLRAAKALQTVTVSMKTGCMTGCITWAFYSTNLEKSQVYSHTLMLRDWMVLICLHMNLG
jgi:hypothetical protein